MVKRVEDSRGFYARAARVALTQPSLRFDRGTLLLEGAAPPDELSAWFRYDPRVDAYRAPAYRYRETRSALCAHPISDRAARYRRLQLQAELGFEPYPHQREALQHWIAAGSRGLIVLPTGAGKTLIGLQALTCTGRDTLILVPTLDLMQQWYALLRLAFPRQTIGLLGGGYHEPEAVSVATYDSAARHSERLGNRYGLLIFDEAHHLPSEFYRVIAEFSLAPYRLGLSATPERADGRHDDLRELIGPEVYRKSPQELAGEVLAPFRIEPILVELSPEERLAYRQALAVRNDFLAAERISLGSLSGWNRFVMASAKTAAGRRAMQAHRQARRIAQATPAKLRVLAELLVRHRGEQSVLFTEDNATAYEISEQFLIPCITHQTRIKERQTILEHFKDGVYSVIVTSKVLNEGVDMPEAAIGIILSGSASAREFIQRLGRILRRREGKRALLYEMVTRDTREERVAQRRRIPYGAAEPAKGENLSLFGNEQSDP